jgi:RNase P subunit RPR2
MSWFRPKPKVPPKRKRCCKCDAFPMHRTTTWMPAEADAAEHLRITCTICGYHWREPTYEQRLEERDE